LAGKHSTHRTSRLPRLVMPVVVSLTVVAVAGGTAALTLTARASGTHQGASASASASANATDLELARADLAQRASRGEARPLPSPTPSRSKSPSPSPTPSHSASPADTGTGASGECEASYYDTGTTTADGEAFDPNALTAANKTLPFNTVLKVTNTANGESVNVRINDRGPYVSGRCLDLTTAAFKAIASLGSGTIDVKYQVVG
jgi:rare lipoprotein A